MDKFGFKVLMFSITVIEIIISATLYFSVSITIVYIISVLLISACIGGNFAILSPTFNKVFGLEDGPAMYGLTGNFIGLASISGPILTKFILEDKKDFLVAFLVGGTFCVIKIFALIMFDEDNKFVFKDNQKNLLTESSAQKIVDETI